MSPTRFERWRRIRQHGRIRFTLLYGLPSAVIFSATLAGVFAAYEGSSSLIGTSRMFGLGGLAFGILITFAIWVGSEEDFRLTIANATHPTTNPVPPVALRIRTRKASAPGVVASTVVLLIVLGVLTGLSFLIMHVVIGLPYWSAPLPVVFLVLAAISQPPDLMDLLFRLEMTFQTKLERSKLGLWNSSNVWISPASDITAGQLHDRICESLREKGIPVPTGSWRKTQAALARGAGVSPWSISQNTFVRKDLDFW